MKMFHLFILISSPVNLTSVGLSFLIYKMEMYVQTLDQCYPTELSVMNDDNVSLCTIRRGSHWLT